MKSNLIYYQIYNILREEICGEFYNPGDKIPSENYLSSRFNVNRHTIRRALQLLKEEGILYSKRGSGVIIQNKKIKYKIGKRVRFSQNIVDENLIAKTIILRTEIRKTSRLEAKQLNINTQEEIQLLETVGNINHIPTVMTKRIISNKRFPNFTEIFKQKLSVTKTLELCGVTDYTRSSTIIVAEQADVIKANLLNCNVNCPLIKTTYVNKDLSGIPIEYSETWFVGERIQLTLES